MSQAHRRTGRRVPSRGCLGRLSGCLLDRGAPHLYTTHLSLDTDPLRLLDPRLPYRQLKIDFEQAFPQLIKLIVVVIDAESRGEAGEAADALAAKLRQEPEWISSVYQPGEGPFFDRQGLLYMDTGDLWKLDERLAKWGPFLGTVIRDPSLRGLWAVLGRAVKKSRRLAQDPSLGDVFSMAGSPGDDAFSLENQARLTQVLDWMGETVQAQLADRPNPRFWQETIFHGSDRQGIENRRLVLVKPRLDYSSFQPAARPLTVLRGVADSIETQYPVRVRLTGDVTVQEEEREAVARGARLAAMLSFVLVSLIVFLGLRSFRLAASIAFTLVIGLVWTAGFATFAIGTLNIISATAPVLFIGLGVDFGIQFGMRYMEARNEGADHALAVRQTAARASGALTLAAVAAALSFFSFLPSSYRGLVELGMIAGTGMFLALVANLTVLPALLTLLPPGLEPTGRRTHARRSVGDVILQHRRAILACTIVVLGAAVAVLPHTRFDINPLNLKDPSTEGVTTFLELLEDPHTTPYSIHILARDFAEAQHLAKRLGDLNEVEKTLTLASFIPDNQEEKLALIEDMAFSLQPVVFPSGPLAAPTPEENARAMQTFQNDLTLTSNEPLHESLAASMTQVRLLLPRLQAAPRWPNSVLEELQKRLLGDLPRVRGELQRLLTARLVTLDDLPSSLHERYVARDGRARLEVFPAQDMSDNEALRQFVEAVQPIASNAVGIPVLLLGAGKEVVKSCIQATGLALAGVTLLLFIVLRRVADTLLVLLPLILTLMLTLALSIVLKLPLNFANVIALPLVLGLGIAFGIYLILRAREGLRLDRLVHCGTSRAVCFSALTTIASFGTLTIADHRGMSTMGLLLSISLGVCLLCSLMILPAVLAELESRGLWSPNAPAGSVPGQAPSEPVNNLDS